MIIGFIVSMVTNELSVSVISLFVMLRVLPAEFVMLIENVALPLVSLGKTGIVNVAFPPLVVFVNDLPRNVPLKLPRSSLSVSRDTVMFLLAFAKLSPEELVIFNEIMPIGSRFTVTVLVTFGAIFPNESAFAEYTIVYVPVTEIVNDVTFEL